MAVLVRGDHELSEAKLQAALGGEPVALADERHGREASPARRSASRARSGSDGARSSPTTRCAALRGAVTGANATDEHLVGVDQARDFPARRLRRSAPGAARRPLPALRGRPSSRATAASRSARSSTSGRSTARRWARPSSTPTARSSPIEMGCYGIGITRTVAAAIEQNHDDDGIVWPLAARARSRPTSSPVNVERRGAARDGRARLRPISPAPASRSLLDDRDERPGVKFKDADLIGLPVRVTVGAAGARPRLRRGEGAARDARRRRCRWRRSRRASPRSCDDGGSAA